MPEGMVFCATLLVSVLAGCGSAGDAAGAQTPDAQEGSDRDAGTPPNDASTPQPDNTAIDFGGLVHLDNWVTRSPRANSSELYNEQLCKRRCSSYLCRSQLCWRLAASRGPRGPEVAVAAAAVVAERR